MAGRRLARPPGLALLARGAPRPARPRGRGGPVAPGPGPRTPGVRRAPGAPARHGLQEARPPGRARAGHPPLAPVGTRGGRPALPPHRRAAAHGGRDRRRPRLRRAHDAPRAGRRGLGQDGRGDVGRRRRGRLRPPSRADGPDRDPRAPALRDPGRAPARGGGARRTPHRARQGRGARRQAGRLGLGRLRGGGGHPRPVPDGGGVPRPRPGGGG